MCVYSFVFCFYIFQWNSWALSFFCLPMKKETVVLYSTPDRAGKIYGIFGRILVRVADRQTSLREYPRVVVGRYTSHGARFRSF